MSQLMDEVAPDVIAPNDGCRKDLNQPLKHLDTVIALYDFPGTQHSHLPLNLGDTIYVLSKSESSWWDGVISNNGELVRGWFPSNYVRSVNYVQPVLNKLKSNKELDSITAANTAANVLIPSFTDLLKKNLNVTEVEKSTNNSSRKNSVVSFASSDDNKSMKHPGDEDSDMEDDGTKNPFQSDDKKSPSGTSSQAQSYFSQNIGGLVTPGGTPVTTPTIERTHSSIDSQRTGSYNDNFKPQFHDNDPTFNSFSSSAASVMDNSTPSSLNRLESFEDMKNPNLLQSSKLGDSEFKITSVEEATEIVANYKKETGNTPTWITKPTIEGNLIFYCNQVDIYCEEVPFINLSMADITDPKIEVPNHSIINDPSLIIDNDNLTSGNQIDMNALDDKGLMFKRDSNVSISSTSSISSLYHHFHQPLYSMDGLFYYRSGDVRYWKELSDEFDTMLSLSLKSIRDNNKIMFHKHFGKLNKLLSILSSSVRLSFHDFQNTKYEHSIKRKCKRMNTSFSSIYISSVLELSYLHHTQGEDGQLFSYDLSKLNKSTSVSNNYNSISTNNSSISTIKQFAISSINEEEPDKELTNMQVIEFEMQNIRLNLSMLVKIFNKITKEKQFSTHDYDGSNSEASDDEEVGIDRHNVLPQNYPRLVADEFNGGNWCNPFFESNKSIFNVSGNDLKTKYHQKILIDRSSYASVKNLVDELKSISDSTLVFLDPENQHLYYNYQLKDERNTCILRLIYKYLHFASSMVDIMESFDFTVFCLITRFNSQEDEMNVTKSNFRSHLQDNASNDGKNKKETTQKPSVTTSETDTEPQSEPAEAMEHGTKSSRFTSNLTFDYPVVLEFFHNKQLLHNLITKIIMATQSLTLEDPEVFKGMKDDDAPLFYSKDIMKNPKQRATILLTNLLVKQLTADTGTAISANIDTVLSQYLKEGISFYNEMLSIIKQLIEERETILNYATRVMHDDFNVQLLVIERNNTSGSDHKDEVNSSFVTGKKRSKDTPWYLEGDDEFDLLSDMKGSIKGGTKEALVCHLTHHDLFDSSFNTAFLHTFASIMCVNELISLLIIRFNNDAPEGLSYEEYNTWVSKKQGPIRLRVLNVMKLLLEKYWSDSYYNTNLINKWLKFLQSPQVSTFSISKTLVNHLNKLSKGERVMIEREPAVPQTKTPAPLIRPSLVKKLKLLDIDYIELARQLTIREFKLYSHITKFQCLAKVWSKKSGLNEDISSITEFIKSSNQLTNFVAYMILRKDDYKKRVQIIRYFVQVAERCRQYNNYSSMTAIISALYSSPIHRLKKTWKFVSNDTFNQLHNMNKLMNSSRNFNEYRDVLKFIGSEPCVPFFGVYLSDLTFIFHGNPDTLLNRNRMINFSKRSKTADILLGLDRFKSTGYNLMLVPEIQKYLEGWFDKCPTIEEQYQLSLNLEPRDQAASNNNNISLNRQKSAFPFGR